MNDDFILAFLVALIVASLGVLVWAAVGFWNETKDIDND